MAARYATDLWTIKEFEEVRRKLVNIRPYFRAQILSELLIVGMRLGAQELLDEVFDEIAEQEDPNTSLYLMIENLKHLNSSDPRCDLLRHYWSLSVASENPNFNVLINGFSLLEPRDQALEWQKLKALAKSTSEPAQFFASLSLVSKSQQKRVELLETAFSECAAETAERRIPQAVQIVSACKTTGEIWRALDLMTSFPSVSRNTAMSTLQLAAPAFTEVGTASFIKALMADIRESAAWWP
ncbi:hypothetical protein [Pseudomonas sp. TWR2-1-1]|uniref:hypothetical protein n=1 Tax=Pseudomonas sp. TWR2-1-1 TaxID=2804610 RepID=UPI003CF8EEB5